MNKHLLKQTIIYLNEFSLDDDHDLVSQTVREIKRQDPSMSEGDVIKVIHLLQKKDSEAGDKQNNHDRQQEFLHNRRNLGKCGLPVRNKSQIRPPIFLGPVCADDVFFPIYTGRGRQFYGISQISA